MSEHAICEDQIIRRIDSVEEYAKRSIDFLQSDLSDHKKYVDHKLSGLTHVVENVTRTMVELEAGHKTIDTNITRLEHQVSEQRKEIAEDIKILRQDNKKLIEESIARKKDHESNSYLIKVVVGLVSSVFLLMVGGIIAYVLKT